MRRPAVFVPILVAALGVYTSAAPPSAGDAAIVHVLNRIGYGPQPADIERVRRMGIDAYIDEDAPMAAALDDLDDRLDAIHKDYIQEIFLANTAGEIQVQGAVQLALIGRYYERIGDHAVNIGERVRYMVTGWLPEQTGAARAAAAQQRPAAVPPPVDEAG